MYTEKKISGKSAQAIAECLDCEIDTYAYWVRRIATIGKDISCFADRLSTKISEIPTDKDNLNRHCYIPSEIENISSRCTDLLLAYATLNETLANISMLKTFTEVMEDAD